jgi:hypothetical protein
LPTTTSFPAGTDCPTSGALRSGLTTGGALPFAFGAIVGFDALEVDTSNFDSASFDASGLTAASATGVDDGEVAVPIVGQDLTSSNVNFWSCGIAMPAPKQANAPAIIRIALSGDRA